MKDMPIPGFGGYYASEDGRILNRKEGRLTDELKQSTTKDGYKKVALKCDHCGGTNQVSVHRLVLMAFKGIPETRLVARHLNGIKSDNTIGNLAWGTRKENEADKLRHGTRWQGEKHHLAKLNASAVLEIRNSIESGPTLAKRFKVGRSTIARIRRMEGWKHVKPKQDELPPWERDSDV